MKTRLELSIFCCCYERVPVRCGATCWPFTMHLQQHSVVTLTSLLIGTTAVSAEERRQHARVEPYEYMDTNCGHQI